jgi:hypothetical protein
MLYINHNFSKPIFKIIAINEGAIRVECLHYKLESKWFTTAQAIVTTDSCSMGKDVKDFFDDPCNELLYEEDTRGNRRSCRFAFRLPEEELKDFKENRKRWAILNSQHDNAYYREMAKLVLEDRIIL